jgi:hypothetical protein
VRTLLTVGGDPAANNGGRALTLLPCPSSLNDAGCGNLHDRPMRVQGVEEEEEEEFRLQRIVAASWVPGSLRGSAANLGIKVSWFRFGRTQEATAGLATEGERDPGGRIVPRSSFSRPYPSEMGPGAGCYGLDMAKSLHHCPGPSFGRG